ncbi:3-oxoadipate enol-lactonase [Nocardia sp. NBC_01377]|uniref:3-oxoadipate enol-lactonase n=1 Tax=Nocardia sp. NBC_01377 TaxID=2903595 RepID=UPI003253C17F
MSGIAVNCVVDGPDDGEPVVLSGSLGSDVRMWEPQVADLVAAGYRVVRYDHRGHGRSPVPRGPYMLAELGEDALALLDRLGIQRAHFVGLSLGGMVGMWLGENARHRLRTLTLCCTSADLGPASGWSERARRVRVEGTGAVARAVVERWFTPQWRVANPDRVPFYEAMVAATPPEGYASCCQAIETMDIAGSLSSITAATLVIAGEQDPATPSEHAHSIAAAIPSSRIESVSPGAHLSNAESPQAVNDLILGHLAANR